MQHARWGPLTNLDTRNPHLMKVIAVAREEEWIAREVIYEIKPPQMQ